MRSRSASSSVAHRALITALGIVLAASTGCGGSPPPPPPPTIVQLVVSAAPDVNPDRDGRPSPVVVQVFQLRNPASFNSADFFQLADNAPAALGPALVAQERITLAPGQSTSLVRPMQDARFLGVTAAFRDIDNSAWRVFAQVPDNMTTPIEAVVGTRTVFLRRMGPLIQ